MFTISVLFGVPIFKDNSRKGKVYNSFDMICIYVTFEFRGRRARARKLGRGTQPQAVRCNECYLSKFCIAQRCVYVIFYIINIIKKIFRYLFDDYFLEACIRAVFLWANVNEMFGYQNMIHQLKFEILRIYQIRL